ncbi:acyl-CoA thioester hydrolase [Dichotomocladium elegans]|nr:acyl-CoA thioester hydrolase [Dichotomocladium elegans]
MLGRQADADHDTSRSVVHTTGVRDRIYSTRRTRLWMDKILERENLKPVTPVDSDTPRKLVEKTTYDSAMVEYLPFKSSPALLDEYIFVDGRIRTGKLLEDLDAMAGAVAYKHIDNGDPTARPVTIVTASVDRFDLFLPEAVEDYKLTAQVTYVGTSSMEIFLKAETVPGGIKDIDFERIHTPTMQDLVGHLNPNTVLATRFTMVAIDSATRKPVGINPLKTTSLDEARLFEIAKENKARRKMVASTALSRFPPTPSERLAIHDIYLEYRKYRGSDDDDSFTSGISVEDKQPLPEDVVWMKDTRLDSNFLMHPQDRNIHNNIFGGYLMRRAYELAYANATVFLKNREVTLLAMDECVFRKPVHVGTLLNLKSEIIYAEGHSHKSFQVRVVAEVVDIEKSNSETTNIFYFTMAARGNQVHPRRVLPKTYAETMLWLEGKRRRQEGVQARQLLLKELSPKN